MSGDEKGLASSKKLFLVGYGVWLVFRLSRLSLLAFPDGSPLNTLMHIGALFIIVLSLAVSLVWEKNPITKRILPFLALFIVGVVQELLIDEPMCVDLALLFLAADRVDFRKIAKYTLWIEGICCAIIVLSSLVGIIPNYYITRSDGVVRYYLGFTYCTFLSHLFFNMVLIVLYIRRENVRYRELGLLAIIDVGIFIATNSKNSFVLVLLILLVAYCIKRASIKRTQRPGRVVQQCARISVIVFPLLSLCIALLYNPQSAAWRTANNFLSNRIAQTHASTERYGFEPFGQDIDFVGNGLVAGGDGVATAEAHPDGDSNFIDNSYMNVLVNNGLVVALIFWVALICTAQRGIREDDSWLSLALLAIAVHSLFDPQLLQLVYNTFLFIIWQELMEFRTLFKNPVSGKGSGCQRIAGRHFAKS